MYTDILTIRYSDIQILPFHIISSFGVLSDGLAFILLHIFYIYRLQTSFADTIWTYSNRTYTFFYVYSLSFVIPTIGLCYSTFIQNYILTRIIGIYWTIFGVLILSFSVLYLFCKRLLELMVASCPQNTKNIEQTYQNMVNMDIIKYTSQYAVLITISNFSTCITLFPYLFISNEVYIDIKILQISNIFKFQTRFQF